MASQGVTGDVDVLIPIHGSRKHICQAGQVQQLPHFGRRVLEHQPVAEAGGAELDTGQRVHGREVRDA